MSLPGPWKEQKVAYNKRDLITYAVGIGCTELPFIYENHSNFQAFPTYPIVLAFKGTDENVVPFPSQTMLEGPTMPQMEGASIPLDGERYIERHESLDVDPEPGEELTLRSRIIGIHKRGSGASVETEAHLIAEDGTLLYKMISGSFFVGAKGFKDAGISFSESVQPPSISPDKAIEIVTSPFQAQIYRISGDYNPLHVDPEFAKLFGFENPILHGLCTMAMSARAVLKTYGSNDGLRFKALKVRFSKPVLPGQTLVVKMWKQGSRIIFNTEVKETGKIVISNAYMELYDSSKL